MSADVGCRCGASARVDDAHRCERGHVLPGNTNALKHGVRAFEARGDVALPPVVRETVDAFREQVIADRGGAANLTAIEGGYVRRLSELEAVVRLLAADLATKGLTTPRGRVRGTFNRWLEALDRWDKFATRVGVERRARPVPSPTEYWAQRVGKRPDVEQRD
jgi:hypothetical protein